MFYSAVIVAGGKGTRMGMSQNKIFCDIGKKPILARTLTVFEQNENICEIVLVCREEDKASCKRIAEENNITKLTKYVKGGLERKDSVYNGICATDKQADFIAIHDAARPFLSQDALNRVLLSATKHRASALGVRCKNTIKVCEGHLMVDTPNRSNLWEVQTPQVFEKQLIFDAFEQLDPLTNITDDCSVVENIGIHPTMVGGEYQNIKITTQDDLDYAEFLLN